MADEIEPGTERSPRQRRDAIALAVLGALVVVFAVLNSQSVKIDWIVTTTRAPLIVVIILCGLAGFALGTLAARRRRR
jgi:uncharacterized integral membrane protein